MWVYGVGFFMAMMTLFFMPFPTGFNDTHTTCEENTIMANEFLLYKEAVNKYARINPGFTGTVPDASLPLPLTINLSGHWHNNIEPGRFVYVYGDIKAGLLRTILAQAKKAITIGVNNNGTLYSPVVGDLAFVVPAWVPNQSILSVIQTN